MPYSPKAERFFGLCAHNPRAAKKKCPKPADSKRLYAEARRLPAKK